jgi:hypothetical protein
MAKIRYKGKRFRDDALSVIAQANVILDDYAAQGFDLTLRQLYYQFVARGLIRNKQSEYNRLGNIVNDARLAGLIDWNHITDRTRNLRALPHWDDPADAIQDWTRRYFGIDLWEDQPTRIEVWIEKDALVGVIAGVCNELDIPYFSCRGYTSQSEMWAAAQRLRGYLSAGQDVRILHLGDHDPSGIDMTRDIEERLSLFLASHAYWGDISGTPTFADGHAPFVWVGTNFAVDRIALTMEQIEEHDPPPNPAKLTDSRAQDYIRNYGDESWELDALPPDYLANLIRTSVEAYIDSDAYDAAVEREQEYKRTLRTISDRWNDVEQFVKEGK